MTRLRVTLTDHPHPYPTIDRWMRLFALELQARWRDMDIRTSLAQWFEHREMPDLQKAQQPTEDDNPIYRAFSFLETTSLSQTIQSILGKQALMLVEQHLGRVFAYGVKLAQQGEEEIQNPQPSQSDIFSISRTPRVLDSRALDFVKAYSFNEISSKDASTFSTLQTRLLETLERRENPLHAIHQFAQDVDGDLVGWSRIARTETARALAAGSFEESKRLGVDYVYVPENGRACEECQRLIVGRVFPLSALEGATNYKRKKENWIPAVPLHPNCTDHTIPASKWLIEQASKSAGGTIPKLGIKVAWVPPNQR